MGEGHVPRIEGSAVLGAGSSIFFFLACSRSRDCSVWSRYLLLMVDRPMIQRVILICNNLASNGQYLDNRYIARSIAR